MTKEKGKDVDSVAVFKVYLFLNSSMVERTAVNRDVVGSSPTKPTTPFPSLHPIQGSRSPRHPADLNLATAPGTTLLPLPFGHASYALAACPLKTAFVIREAAER